MKVMDVVLAKEYKKIPEERYLPVYEIFKEGTEEIEYVVIPVFGYGLWDNIWGFVALESDLKTVKGVVFDHKGETPGLGQRIATDDIQNRYVGKQIKDNSGNIISIVMVKGERGGGERSIKEFENETHMVDGMSGATITANGLNEMLKDYFLSYANYFKSKMSN
jgi:Na+-transporting NADH:ubiquinone oxidoreductase subunit C